MSPTSEVTPVWSRLRTRLLAFFGLAALPVLMVSAGAVVLLDRLIEEEMSIRSGEVVRQVEAFLRAEQGTIRRAISRAAVAPEVRQLAATFDEITPGQSEILGSRLAGRLALDILGIAAIEADGPATIVSSAHLAASVGDPAPAFTRGHPELSDVGLVFELVQGNPPELAPALVAVATVHDTGAPRLLVYGGTRLDARRLDSLARAGGATLQLNAGPEGALVFGDGRRSSGSPAAVVDLPSLDPATSSLSPRMRVFVSNERLEAARSIFVEVSVIALAGSLVLALLFATVLSRRLTRPISALAVAAQRVGRGDLDARVPPRGRDEVGQLVRAFNSMVEELDQARDRVVRAERVAAWREVARRVAHEIKNPLFPIQVSMETLRKSFRKQHPKLEEILEESTATVLEEVSALDRIVSEFSEFARMPPAERRPCTADEILDRVRRLYENHVGDNEVRLVVDLDDVPTLQADPEQVAQAMANLVKNAIEAIGTGPGTVTLSARSQACDRVPGMVLEVRDDGPGLPAGVDVFEPYVTTKTTGTGLGLAIVERIVQDHGGELSVASAPGEGTTFSLWLPQGS